MHLSWLEDWSIHSAMHFWLLMAWVVFWYAIFYDLLLLGVGPCRIIGLPSPSLLCIHSVALLTFSVIPLCYSYCNRLTQSCWASLSLLFISLPVTQCVHWAFSYIVCELLCPISLLGILGPFAFLGFSRPFSNPAFPWAFTNSLGLPWPNYFIPHHWGWWVFY